MLTEKRDAIKHDLETVPDDWDGPPKPAGFRAFEYVGETITPPCAAVIPAEPYLQYPDGNAKIPFRHVRLRIDVLLLSTRETSKTAAALTDQLIEWASARLSPNYDITAVSRPGVVTISGSKFVGSVLSIEELTEAP